LNICLKYLIFFPFYFEIFIKTFIEFPQKLQMGPILQRVQKDKVSYIHLQFSDIEGSVKSVTIPSHKLKDALDGLWFDGSSIEGFTRIAESDMFLKPDTSTYTVFPWNPGTARIICDVYTSEGKPFEGDPRYVLKRAIEEAGKKGFTYNVGPELEFFLFKTGDGVKPAPHDSAGYFDFSPMDAASVVMNEISSAAELMGIECEMSHHEVANSQHEVDFRYGDALKTADRTITLKCIIKSAAQKHGLFASFMPKPVFGINGSGMHIHQSLFRNGKNAFYSPDDRYRLSKTAYHFIAGQLKHAKSIAAIVAPTVNSYKRLVPGYEAPVYICWGRINRSALIRIPRCLESRQSSARAELRCPDPSCSPYLAFAVMLKSGLDGIEKELSPPEPVEENVYEFDDRKLKEKGIGHLPGSLWEALGELRKDKVIREALGEHLFRKYMEAKTKEWSSYRRHVTGWEIKQYLERV
jgi:glutamine synthetase